MRQRTIFLPVTVFLLLAFILFYPPLTWSGDVPAAFWIKQMTSLVIMTSAFYLNAQYVAPRLLSLPGKTTNFVIWFIVATLVILAVARIIEYNLGMLDRVGKQKSPFSLDTYLMIVTLLVLLGSTSLAGARRWQTEALQHEINQKQQIASELAVLKAQINPHFFFNTLNNIYALTYSDIPMSREALLKLSRMMRYVLYDTMADKSLLSKELDFIEDYIELMTIRTPGSTSVRFEVEKTDEPFLIAPMLLLPFIENAFKHGTNSAELSSIAIEVGMTGNMLRLHVFNDINQHSDKLLIGQKGIGLANTQKRLDLLYPGRYQLAIDTDPERRTFDIRLQIELEQAGVLEGQI